jgi:uncharacterized RDD family membrane protein YckC
MSRAAPELTVDSVTGIDVSLAVAGPGARAYAFIIDWHIRLVVALAWYVSAALLYNGHLSLLAPDTAPGRWFGLVLLPAAAIYFLYHWVLELAMRGRTPGKRMAGVQIVARDGSAPTAGALLSRNVFRLIDCLPVAYGVGLIAVAFTDEQVRIGDMAAGTLLVYERLSAAPAIAGALLPGSPLDAAGLELVQELLARWSALEPAARSRLAQQLLARYGGDGSVAPDTALRSRLERLTGT